MARQPVRRCAAVVVLPLALLGTWEAVARLGWVNPVLLPPPSATAAALVDLAVHGGLFTALAETALRAAAGMLIATVGGLLLGAAVATSPTFDALSGPVREFFRALPTVVVIPALMLILGFGTGLSLVAVVFAAIWPVLLNTVHGIRTIDPTLLDVARVRRLGPVAAQVRVRLPAALPSILTGVRISLAIALVVALVTEMIASNGGLGTMVIEARSRYRSTEVFAIVATIGALGLVANGVMENVERRVIALRQ